MIRREPDIIINKNIETHTTVNKRKRNEENCSPAKEELKETLKKRKTEIKTLKQKIQTKRKKTQ